MRKSKHMMAFLKSSKLTSWAPNFLIKFKRLMSRPAGFARLGSSPTTTNVCLGECEKNQQA